MPHLRAWRNLVPASGIDLRRTVPCAEFRFGVGRSGHQKRIVRGTDIPVSAPSGWTPESQPVCQRPQGLETAISRLFRRDGIEILNRERVWIRISCFAPEVGSVAMPALVRGASRN